MNLLFPYSYIYVTLFFLGIIPPLPHINGYTHWIVTQHGMIEPLTTSYYHLRQPWNLIKLIQQEQNFEFIQRIELKLNQVSNDLQANQDYQNKVQKYYVDSDSACVRASKLLSEFELHSNHILTLEAKGINTLDHLDEGDLEHTPSNQLQQPLCQSIFNKKFSMCCFEHLEILRNRSLFEGVPEISLYKIALPQHLTPSEYGHLVALSLENNLNDVSSNWILYNMAAFYWRVKGSARNAIECLRAALHTSPWKYQDIALVSLANVIQLIKTASLDALVLMKNAILVSPEFTSHHVILGNIYASFGQFNNSLHHYQRAASLHKPHRDKITLNDIEERIFAARCSLELSMAISTQQNKLDKQLEELESFQIETNHYQDLKISISHQSESNLTQIKRQNLYEASEFMKTIHETQCLISDSLSQKELLCEPGTESLISTLFENAKPLPNKPINRIFTQYKITENEFLRPSRSRVYKSLKMEQYKPQSHITINESICKQLKCQYYDTSSPSSVHLSIYLSPSNKGFNLDNLLTKQQHLSIHDEHPLPWHPPYCSVYVNTTNLLSVDLVDNLESLKYYNLVKYHDIDMSHFTDKKLLHDLLKLVQGVNMKLEDIGQRIVTAIKQQLISHWIMFNIAGLYWRVMGNVIQALECQRLSVKLSPLEYRDVPIVNLAVILAKLNRNRDSMKLIKAALKIDYSEPETHLLAATLYKEESKFHLVYHHLEIAISQNSSFNGYSINMDSIKCELCKSQYQSNLSINSFDRDAKLKENITQIFINYNMCSSMTECSHIVAQNYRFLPHIKITIKGPTFSPADIEKLTRIELNSMSQEASKSHVMYGILWNTNLSNLHVQEHDCLLTNDTSRSAGCHRNEEIFAASQNAINFLSELQVVVERASVSEMVKSSSNQHFCHNESLKKPNHDEVNQSTLKLTANDIQETIINLISSRVVMNPLAPEDCEHVAPFDFKTYTPLYVSLNTMRINVLSLIDSLTPGYSFSFNQHPYCTPKGINFLRQIVEKYKVDFETSQYSKVPEYNLHTSFLKTFDDKYTLDEIGKRLQAGIEQNASDWRLATISVNYWRIIGDAQQAFNCLELAMENSPEFHEKVILVNAANILYRINKLEAALEITYKSMQYPDGQNWIVIPFLVANIFATMEQWHKANLFYEACLSLKADFEEAIYRIKSIQCQQMVLQNLEQH